RAARIYGDPAAAPDGDGSTMLGEGPPAREPVSRPSTSTSLSTTSLPIVRTIKPPVTSASTITQPVRSKIGRLALSVPIAMRIAMAIPITVRTVATNIAHQRDGIRSGAARNANRSRTAHDDHRH